MDICARDLRDHVLKMASLVEASLSGSLNLDKSLEDIFELEKKINEFHMLIDDACFKYIALKSPTAKDLRTAIAVMKINADLE
ncbi:MAG: phosphate transport system regulatory protein PhoU, partial [Bdellovibrionales bacterium]|nr:phosphate transport system regulatory protein PhoU [Bdellovibrionales bacterium]